MALITRVRAAVGRKEVALPPFPALAHRLREVLADEQRSNARLVARLVENDPALAAAILRVANSALYGGLHPIGELSQAISRIGLRQVGLLVTAVLHKGHFETTDGAKAQLLETLWYHAVTTAIAARRLAGMARGDREESFLAGLLHDVGKLLVLKCIDHLERHERLPHPEPGVALEIMDLLHAEVGHDALQAWRLPEPICAVALAHHEESPAPGGFLLLRVQAANAIAARLGASVRPQPELNLHLVPAIERLNLTDVDLASMMVDLEDEVAAVRSLF